MSGVAKKLMGTTAAGGGFTAIEDVFSTYLYTGNGSTQTITNGIDLAGEGGLVWIKNRSAATDHLLVDTVRGATKRLATNLADAAQFTELNGLTAFGSDGFTIGSDSKYNTSSATYTSWSFKKQPNFFDVVTYTGNGSARTIAHGLGSTPGMIVVKEYANSTVGSTDWVVYHRSLGATQRIFLNTTGAAATSSSFWNNTEPTETEFSLGTNGDVNRNGSIYVAYLYAHDPLGPSGDGSDGLIACGSFTTDGSGNATVDLGWEPQWLLTKKTNSTGDWTILDSMRGFPTLGLDNNKLYPNTSGAEVGGSSFGGSPDASGFKWFNDLSSQTYIYIAIRRGPMRAPESGTEVFALNTYNGTGGAQTITTTIDAPDAALSQVRNTGGWSSPIFYDRVRGKVGLFTDQTAAEIASADYGAVVLSNAQRQEVVGTFGSSSGKTYVTRSFKRAPEFFDVVAYKGGVATGAAIPHNLGVAPELVIIKSRSGPTPRDWMVALPLVGPDGREQSLSLNLSSGVRNERMFPSGGLLPDENNFYLAGENLVNSSTDTYIAYLFSTLAGVSKVGSYTGNGSSQTINCGFTTGARFILIKRTDSTGDWYVWDTARGIVAANDPHLSLNTTAAEVTTDDSIDPDSSGFIVNQVAATNINVSAASYIFYAVS